MNTTNKPIRTGPKKHTPSRGSDGNSREKPLKPRLVEEIASIDKAILKLFLKRFNLLEKLRKNGHIPASDEKALREAWQKEAIQLSRDPALTSKIFPLLQSLSFLPKPDKETAGAVKRESSREAFSLHPPRLPVKINLTAPLSSRLTRIWLYMGCALGQPLSLQHLLMNTPLTNFIRIMEKLGAKFNFDVDNIAILPNPPIACPDDVIHTGNDPLNFYIILSHYLIRPARAKIMGELDIGQEVFFSLTSFLASLGCRLTPAIPKNIGLPARIECSGLLPAAITFPADLPEDFALALAISCLFYEQPVALNFARLPARANFLSGLIPLLEQAGATFKIDNFTLNFDPAPLTLPGHPVVPFDLCVASFLLSLPMALTGKCQLYGTWPDWNISHRLKDFLIGSGIPWNVEKKQSFCQNSELTWHFQPHSDASSPIDGFPAWTHPLICALAACACLNGGTGTLPAQYLEDLTTQSFLEAAGLASDSQGKLEIVSANVPLWNPPDSAWAMALALTACSGKNRPPLKLGNPGIVTELWGYFWQLYNSLPAPGAPAAKAPSQPAKPTRRRIHTNSIAVLPRQKEEN